MVEIGGTFEFTQLPVHLSIYGNYGPCYLCECSESDILMMVKGLAFLVFFARSIIAHLVNILSFSRDILNVFQRML